MAVKNAKKTTVRRRRERKNIERGAVHIPVSYTHLDVYKRQVVRATIDGLASLRTAEQMAEIRGKSVKEILG